MLIPRSVKVLSLVTLLSMPAIAQRSPQPVPSTFPPDELFAPVGTVLAVQVQDHLSSDKNKSGDEFVGMLQQPLVIDGWVVARQGQTVMGQITSVNNAGRVKGTSDLGIELIELVLVDGHQAPIQTQLLRNSGKESHNDDAVTIAGVGVLGTVIGAAAGGGKGALIGAGIGVGAATAGVLSTRGKPVDIYPETTLTFRLDAPLAVSTVRSQQAFLPVVPEDFDKTPSLKSPPTAPRAEREARSYEPGGGRYPRFPGSGGPRIVVVPPIILFPPVIPIIIDHRGHGRRY